MSTNEVNEYEEVERSLAALEESVKERSPQLAARVKTGLRGGTAAPAASLQAVYGPDRNPHG